MNAFSQWSTVPLNDDDLHRHCVITDVRVPDNSIAKPVNIRLFVDPQQSRRDAYSLMADAVSVPVLVYFDEYKEPPFPRKGKGGKALYDRISDYWADPLCDRLTHLHKLENFLRYCTVDYDKVDPSLIFTPMLNMYQYIDSKLNQLNTFIDLVMPDYNDDLYYYYYDVLKDTRNLQTQERAASDACAVLMTNVQQRALMPDNYVDFDFIFG